MERRRCAQMWQGAALDALAAWLGEDGGRVEPRLASRDACQRFVALFAAHAPLNGDSEALSRLLDPFLRILRRSPRVSVRGPLRWSSCDSALKVSIWHVISTLPLLRMPLVYVLPGANRWHILMCMERIRSKQL